MEVGHVFSLWIVKHELCFTFTLGVSTLVWSGVEKNVFFRFKPLTKIKTKTKILYDYRKKKKIQIVSRNGHIPNIRNVYSSH